MFAKKMFFNKKVVRGFTLVEIVVVLVILAILVATAIPSLIGFVDDAKKKSLANEVRAVYTAAQAYATEHFGNGDLDDDQIKNDICGLINSEHSLYYLLQKDATGTVLDVDVENGKVKSIKYTKDSINNLEADYFIDDGVQFVQLNTDTGAIVNASSAVTNINIDDLKAEIKAEIKADLKSNFDTDFKSNVINLAYPVGSFYVSYNSTSPATLFGGEWTQITDKFLYCANSAGTTGGSSTHKHTTGGHQLTVDEMPKHRHTPVLWNETDKWSWRVGTRDMATGGTAAPYIDWSATKSGGVNDTNYNLRTTWEGGNGSHSHGDTGSSSSMPPYMTVYCWRRTA